MSQEPVVNQKAEKRTAAETRDEILRVSLELFTEKGFEGTSVRDIARALGITQSALYYHFTNKNDIVATLMSDRADEIDELIQWMREQPRSPGLLREAALRWVDRTTPERLTGMRLALSNQPLIARFAGSAARPNGPFGQIFDLVLDADATEADRLHVRLVFGTVNAALVAARGSAAGHDEIIEVARRAVVALTRG